MRAWPAGRRAPVRAAGARRAATGEPDRPVRAWPAGRRAPARAAGARRAATDGPVRRGCAEPAGRRAPARAAGALRAATGEPVRRGCAWPAGRRAPVRAAGARHAGIDGSVRHGRVAPAGQHAPARAAAAPTDRDLARHPAAPARAGAPPAGTLCARADRAARDVAAALVRAGRVRARPRRDDPRTAPVAPRAPARSGARHVPRTHAASSPGSHGAGEAYESSCSANWRTGACPPRDGGLPAANSLGRRGCSAGDKQPIAAAARGPSSRPDASGRSTAGARSS